jgi:hypothetical protein
MLAVLGVIKLVMPSYPALALLSACSSFCRPGEYENISILEGILLSWTRNYIYLMLTI